MVSGHQVAAESCCAKFGWFLSTFLSSGTSHTKMGDLLVAVCITVYHSSVGSLSS